MNFINKLEIKYPKGFFPFLWQSKILTDVKRGTWVHTILLLFRVAKYTKKSKWKLWRRDTVIAAVHFFVIFKIAYSLYKWK